NGGPRERGTLPDGQPRGHIRRSNRGHGSSAGRAGHQLRSVAHRGRRTCGSHPMSSAHHDDGNAADTRNLSRFFVENREIAWVALGAACVWGIYGYATMPQRRDPDVPTTPAMIVTASPRATAEKVEQLVTKPIEKTVASHSSVARIESVSRLGVSVVTFTLSSHL